MNTKEKELFRSLSSFKSDKFDESLIQYATPEVLGHLFFNRMQGVAYGVLKQHGLLGKVNREFRNSLKEAYEQNIMKNHSFFACISYLNRVLSDCTGKYAMLKGAWLCGKYPDGYRTSNDIDLLVLPESVTEIGNELIKAGFRQGNTRNGEFVPATRQEIIESKMMRGETVPYIKKMNFTGMKYLEVDINFSLDYKNNETDALDNMIGKAHIRDGVMTLDKSDFFIHLCGHLYKEATTLPWIEMMRDMTLYKYCDIYMLLDDLTESETNAMFIRAKELEMDKICAFAILQTMALFEVGNVAAANEALNVLKNDGEFLHRVISPKDKKNYVYKEKNIVSRFFADRRKDLIEEDEK